MDVDDVAVLTGPRGGDIIAEAALGVETEGELRTLERLRATHGPGLAAAALTQVTLRRGAVAKFGADAAHLLFTRDGLEQATRARVAAWRASELAAALRVGGLPPAVVDLGCGIGADLIAFARAGLDVTGVERDPVRAALAEANAAALGLRVDVRRLDATDPGAISLDAAVFLDPARRDAGGRIWSTRGWSPPWSFVVDLLTAQAQRDSGPPAVVVKAAPAIPHHQVPSGAAADWVSDDGDVVEACLWSRALHARPEGTHRAILLAGDAEPRILEGDPANRASVGEIAAYLHEPDGAVIRAGLVGTFADRVGGWVPADGIGYLFSDEPAPSGYATTYRVLEELPHRTKALRAELRRLGIGSLTIKKRGVAIDPDRLRSQLLNRDSPRPKTGGKAATLVFTRAAVGRIVALLVEPVPRTPNGG